jgi:hypothetical protein
MNFHDMKRLTPNDWTYVKTVIIPGNLVTFRYLRDPDAVRAYFRRLFRLHDLMIAVQYW